jgi:serine/threonine protein kinase
MLRFRIGAHIGSGGFGTVEEAALTDDDGNALEDALAQKKLLPKWENDAQALARFQREVRMLSEMEHPNILPVIGRNLGAKPPWFIMPRAAPAGRLSVVPSELRGDTESQAPALIVPVCSATRRGALFRSPPASRQSALPSRGGATAPSAAHGGT